jgi:hypothetical protein
MKHILKSEGTNLLQMILWRSVKSNIFLCAIILQLFSLQTSVARKAVAVIPSKGKNVSVIIKGKERTYYALPKQNSIMIQIDGPGKLYIRSRLSLPQQSAKQEKYSVVISEGATVIKTYSTLAEKSVAYVKTTNASLGKSRKFSLKVPEGNHTYIFHLANSSSDEALLKFSFSAPKGKKKLVTLEPLAYDKVVTALVKEKLISYYVNSKKRSVQLRVIGPTKIKISTRLNYDASMKGKQKYTLAMMEGGTKILQKPLSTSKSVGVMYKEWKDVVPGKAVSFYFDVPSGEHLYKFVLNETIAASVSLKFSIPKKDLNNEE